MVGVDRDADGIDAADEAWVHTGAVEVRAPDIAGVEARPVDESLRARGRGQSQSQSQKQ